jgi:hypothetical protein
VVSETDTGRYQKLTPGKSRKMLINHSNINGLQAILCLYIFNIVPVSEIDTGGK